MKVLTELPVAFVTGDVLDPSDLNENAMYVKHAADDAFQKRYTHSTVTLPFVVSCASGIHQGLATETRRIRFKSPEGIVVERAYLIGNVTTGGEVGVHLYKQSDNSAPSGAVNPILTLASGLTTATETRDLYGNSVLLDRETDYCFEVSGESTFSTERCDLLLHLSYDRFSVSGVDARQDVSIETYTEADALSASGLLSGVAATEAAIVENTGNNAGYKPMFFMATNLTSSTDADTLRWEIPRVDGQACRANVVRLYAWAQFDSAGGVGETVTWSLQDSSGGSTGLSVSLSMNGKTFESGSASGSVSLSGTSLSSAETSQDYRVTVVSNSAVNCVRAYALLWLE